MKIRLITAATIAGALALSVSGAQAATPTLDGTKVKVLEISGSGGSQDNDADQVTGLVSSPDKFKCEMPRCMKLTFTYKPAKGVQGDLLFSASWGNTASDMDLYVGELAKDGSATDVGHCGGTGSNSEKVFIPAANLKSGKQYVMLVDFFRSLNETVNAKVEIAVPSTVKTTVPAQYDGKFPGTLFPINCTL